MGLTRCFWQFFAIPLILSSCLISSTIAKTGSEIAKQAFPSVVILVTRDNSGQPLSLGSGFFVRSDMVATNLHVIEGAAGGYAKLVGSKAKYEITGYVGIDEQSDLILLKVKDVNAPVLTIGDSSKVAVGDELFVIGNPQGLEGTFSKGIVSAIRTVEKDSILQITASISPGSSGGPVLNDEGKVIGIAVATFKEGQNLNFAIPVSYLSSLLSTIKPVKALVAQEKGEKKDKSILSDLGGRSTEGIVGAQLIWESPLIYSDNGFSFTIRNQLQQSVQDVYCLVIFYDREDKPLDIAVIQYGGIIPAGLGKRVKGSVDGSIKRLTASPEEQKSDLVSSLSPSTKVEIRILDFKIISE